MTTQYLKPAKSNSVDGFPDGDGISIEALEEAFHIHAQSGVLSVENAELVLAYAFSLYTERASAGKIEFTSEDFQAALNAVLGSPVSGCRNTLTLAEILDLAHSLVPGEPFVQAMSATSETMCQPPSETSVVGNLTRKCKDLLALLTGKCCGRGGEKGFASGLKPTTRLVITVALLSFFTALIVGGVAVGLSWTSAVNQQNDALMKELDLVVNAANAFAFVQAQQQQRDCLVTSAFMVGEVLDKVAYQTTLATETKALLNGVSVTGMMLDYVQKEATADKLESLANNTAKLLDLFCLLATPTAPANLSLLVQTLLFQPNQLPYDHEIIVASNQTRQILHPLKFKTQCSIGGTCTVATDPASPMGLALQRKTGGFEGPDYTNAQLNVYGGYSYMPCFQAGLIYQVKSLNVHQHFLKHIIEAADNVNSQFTGSAELLVEKVPGVPLTKPRFASSCPLTGCGNDTAGARAIRSIANLSTPTAIDTDYRQSALVLAAAYESEAIDAFLVLETDLGDVLQDLVDPLKKASSMINRDLNGTLEILLGRKTVTSNGTVGYQLLTQRRYVDECPNGVCLPAEALRRATALCQTGSGFVQDYRNVTVLGSYKCIEHMELGVALKIDNKEIQANSVSRLVDYVDSQNSAEATTLELMVGTTYPANPSAAPIFLSQPKGLSNKLAGRFEPMVEATRGKSGRMRSTDQRGESVIAGYEYLPSLGVGLVLKVDVHEVEKPLIVQLLIIQFTAVGIAVLGIVIVGQAAKVMLKSITDTWERSRKAVQEQKEGFENLVSALYPKFASEKLLAGESQIALEIPQATMFFSDIVGFSTISNRLTVQELMGWIGYTFGVMDRIADFYKIHKIKTIGDAYFAMAGLPGSIPENEKDDHSLRMVKFASSCVQVFSGRYLHPDAGACLQMIAAHSQVMRKEKRDIMKKKRMSRVSTGTGMTGTSSDPAATARGGPAGGGGQGQCAMRYGIASGPVTVGVLPGKCPAFDVWGKTVNLASRMESGSRPNGILCSEGVYQIVSGHLSNPFTFFDQINVYAKGFGNVPAYFLCWTDEILPKALLADLSLEPERICH